MSNTFILGDVISENGGDDGGRVWIRRYPPIPGAPCPVCNTGMFREKSLSVHVKAHFKGCSPSLAEKWACSMCRRQYDTRQGVANHFSQAHTTASGEDNGSSQHISQLAPLVRQTNSCSLCSGHFGSIRELREHEAVSHQAVMGRHTDASEDEVEVLARQPNSQLVSPASQNNNARGDNVGRSSQPASQLVPSASQGNSCSYCGSHFSTIRGLRNHERARHQVAVSDTLAAQDDTRPTSPDVSRSKSIPRLPWSIEEINRFRKAVEIHGLRSNKILAEVIGTRTSNQVAHFKQRYIKDHEQWAYRHLNAPSLGSQKDQATQSSPSTSPSSRRSVSSQSQPPDSLGSPDSRTTAEEVSSPSSSDISIPLATKGQRNPLIVEADQILVRLRTRIHPTLDKGAEDSTSPQHPSTTPKDQTAYIEGQTTSLTPAGLLQEGDETTRPLVWNDADAVSSGGGEEMYTPPPIEDNQMSGDDSYLEILLPPPPSFSGAMTMEPIPEDPLLEETTSVPPDHEEEMTHQIERSRHGVDPELRDYINGDLTKTATGQARTPKIWGPHQSTGPGLQQKTSQVSRAPEKVAASRAPRVSEKVSAPRRNPCGQPPQRSANQVPRAPKKTAESKVPRAIEKVAAPKIPITPENSATSRATPHDLPTQRSGNQWGEGRRRGGKNRSGQRGEGPGGRGGRSRGGRNQRALHVGIQVSNTASVAASAPPTARPPLHIADTAPPSVGPSPPVVGPASPTTGLTPTSRPGQPDRGGVYSGTNRGGSGGGGWSVGRYNWFGPGWRRDTGHIPHFEHTGDSQQNSDSQWSSDDQCWRGERLHGETPVAWEEWEEGPRGKDRASGYASQRNGGADRGRGGNEWGGQACGGRGSQETWGGGGGRGRGNSQGLERGVGRDRPTTDKGRGQMGMGQSIQRGIANIRSQVERGYQIHSRDQSSRPPPSAERPTAQPPNDDNPHHLSTQVSFTLTRLPMDPKDDQAPTRLFEPLKGSANCRMNQSRWDEWCRKLSAWIKGFSAWSHSRYVASLKSPQSTNPTEGWRKRRQDRGNNPPQVQTANPSNRNRVIRRKANLQKLYRANPKACMGIIRKSPSPPRCDISMPAVYNYFRGKNSQPHSDTSEAPPPFPIWPQSTEVDILEDPFTEQEVEATLKGLPSNSAPGPDRLRYSDWKRLGSVVPILTVILNTCRVNKKVPLSWKTSSTILIHKAGDTTNLDNWRPIALQNTAYKVYAGVIAKRVTNWAIQEGKLSPSQKGFLPYEGCLEHNFVLRSVLQDARRRKRDLTISWLDLKDAYSSVPHSTLLRILRLAGLGGATIDIIQDIYAGSTTCVRTKSETSASIACERGVKQGCPLSPILFNFVMESIIRSVEEVHDAGYKIANSSITTLAYADDLCVLSSSRTLMQQMMDRAHQAGSWAGLTFNTKKCASLTILRGQGRRQRAVPFQPKLGMEVIPALTWNESYKYLGCRAGADPKAEVRQVGEEYLQDCEAIMKSDLSDWQKLDALHRFAKPRLVYPLQNLTPPIRWATNLDKAVRKVVKQCLKLPRRTITSFLYSPTRRGGLGIPNVVDDLNIYMVSSAFKLLSSQNDPKVKDIALHELQRTANTRRRDLQSSEEFINSLPIWGEGKRGDLKSMWSDVRVAAHHCGVKFQLNRNAITCGGKSVGWNRRRVVCRLMRSGIQETYVDRLKQASDQGRAMECVSSHASSNHWITTGDYTSFGEYRFALKARLNLLPTRTVRRRAGEKIADVSCPQCYEEQDTLAHALNHCNKHVGLFRHRHNNILGRLFRAIPESMGQKYKEQTFPGDTSRLKPDLFVLNELSKEAFVVDVTIPFEGSGAFQEAREGKEKKYEYLKALLHNRGYGKVEVDALVVGSLGSWDPANDRVLTKLGIGRRYSILFRKLCCTEAIKGSFGIWKARQPSSVEQES
eukprot:Em0264g2a